MIDLRESEIILNLIRVYLRKYVRTDFIFPIRNRNYCFTIFGDFIILWEVLEDKTLIHITSNQGSIINFLYLKLSDVDILKIQKYLIENI